MAFKWAHHDPTNHGVGTINEYVEVEKLLYIVKVHLLSAYKFLKKRGGWATP